jgi:hypothetical protein
MAYNIKISCEPSLSAEDIARLVLVNTGSDKALKIVKV